MSGIAACSSSGSIQAGSHPVVRVHVVLVHTDPVCSSKHIHCNNQAGSQYLLGSVERVRVDEQITAHTNHCTYKSLHVQIIARTLDGLLGLHHQDRNCSDGITGTSPVYDCRCGYYRYHRQPAHTPRAPYDRQRNRDVPSRPPFL